MNLKKWELAIPAVSAGILCLLIYLCFSIFPCGKLTNAWADARQQTVPILIDLKEILTGRQSLFMNMHNAGGMDMWSVILFFASSPLHLLTVFVPKENMLEFYELLIFVKIILSALTSYLFFKKRNPALTVLLRTVLACMYAFSGFTMMFYQNVVWLDMAYLFPLLLLGLDRLFEKNRPGLYIAVLVAELCVNYYLSYMVVIFLLLYTGFRLCIAVPARDRGRLALAFVKASLTAALLTAVIWLPCLIAVRESARGTSLLTNIKGSKLKTNWPTTIPFLYCTGIFVPALFFFPYKGLRKRPLSRVDLYMTVLLLIPLFLDPINRMWHTGDYQCFPVRYGYMTALYMLQLVAESFEAMIADHKQSGETGPEEEESYRRRVRQNLAASIFCMVVIILLATFLVYWQHDEKEIMSSYTSTLWGSKGSLAALTVAFTVTAAAYAVCLIFGKARWFDISSFGVVIATVMVLEVFFQGGVYMGYPASDQSGYKQVLDLDRRIDDTGFYRVKTRNREIEANWMGAAGMPTFSHYTSLTNQDTLFALKKLGYSSYWMQSDSQGGTDFSDALLGVSYTVAYNTRIKSGEEPLYSNDIYSIVRSGYDFPDAIVTDARPDEIIATRSGNRMLAQDTLYKLLFDGEGDLFICYEATDKQNLAVTDDTISLTGDSTVGQLVYDIYIDGRQTLYFDCFEGRYNTRLNAPANKSCMITVNGKVVVNQYPLQKLNGILDLGTYENESIRVEVMISKNLTHLQSFELFSLAEETMRELERTVKGTDLTFKGSRIIADYTTKNSRETLLIPIPYHPGYTVEINGKKAILYTALSGFMCVELGAGENHIEIRYETPGMWYGLMLSAVGILLLMAAAVWRNLKRRKKTEADVSGVNGPAADGPIVILEQPVRWWHRPAGILPYLWLTAILLAIYILPMIINLTA
ncbi:MAG: YfhO family protein [Firmicutes bacterium]|nr:YfhO family protein [Bacillota bacterium]